MPVQVKKIGTKFRIVEGNGAIAVTKNGKPRDGGGHTLKSKAGRQASVINANLKENK